MSDTLSAYNDGPGTVGGLPHGIPGLTVSITIATVATSFVVQACSPKAGSQRIEQQDGAGRDTGAVVTPRTPSCSFTLQLALTTTALPTIGLTFTYDAFKSGSAPTWIIEDVSPKYEQNGFQLVDIETHQRINTPSS